MNKMRSKAKKQTVPDKGRMYLQRALSFMLVLTLATGMFMSTDLFKNNKAAYARETDMSKIDGMLTKVDGQVNTADIKSMDENDQFSDSFFTYTLTKDGYLFMNAIVGEVENPTGTSADPTTAFAYEAAAEAIKSGLSTPNLISEFGTTSELQTQMNRARVATNLSQNYTIDSGVGSSDFTDEAVTSQNQRIILRVAPSFAGYSSYQTQHRMASETGTKSVSGSSPGYGNVSTATATVYYRSFTDKETGAATEPEIYYNDAATGNVVKAWNGSYYDWSYNIAENEFATQSENQAVAPMFSLGTNLYSAVDLGDGRGVYQPVAYSSSQQVGSKLTGVTATDSVRLLYYGNVTDAETGYDSKTSAMDSQMRQNSLKTEIENCTVNRAAQGLTYKFKVSDVCMNANADEKKYVSAIIYTQDGQELYYGRLAEVPTVNGIGNDISESDYKKQFQYYETTDMDVELTIPALDETSTFRLAIFEETDNGSAVSYISDVSYAYLTASSSENIYAYNMQTVSDATTGLNTGIEVGQTTELHQYKNSSNETVTLTYDMLNQEEPVSNENLVSDSKVYLENQTITDKSNWYVVSNETDTNTGLIARQDHLDDNDYYVMNYDTYQLYAVVLYADAHAETEWGNGFDVGASANKTRAQAAAASDPENPYLQRWYEALAQKYKDDGILDFVTNQYVPTEASLIALDQGKTYQYSETNTVDYSGLGKNALNKVEIPDLAEGKTAGTLDVAFLHFSLDDYGTTTRFFVYKKTLNIVSNGEYANASSDDVSKWHTVTENGIEWNYLLNKAGRIQYLYSNQEDALAKLTIQNTPINGFYNKNDNDVLVIPETVNGIVVEGIGGGTKETPFVPYNATGKDEFDSILFPEAVTTINDYAFFGTTAGYNTETVNKRTQECATFQLTIPEHIKYIGIYAFQNADYLASVKIKSAGTTIGYRAFDQCDRINTVGINSSTEEGVYTTIDQNAFANDEELTTVVITGNANIRQRAFMNDSAMEVLNITNMTGNIGFESFRNCTGLVTLYIPETIVLEAAESDTDHEHGYSFRNCTGLEKLEYNALALNDYSFSGCAKISTLILDENVSHVYSKWGGYPEETCDEITLSLSRNIVVKKDGTQFYFTRSDTTENAVYYSSFGYANGAAEHHDQGGNVTITYLSEMTPAQAASVQYTSGSKKMYGPVVAVENSYVYAAESTDQTTKMGLTAYNAASVSFRRAASADDELLNEDLSVELEQTGIDILLNRTKYENDTLEKKDLTVSALYSDSSTGSPYQNFYFLKQSDWTKMTENRYYRLETEEGFLEAAEDSGVTYNSINLPSISDEEASVDYLSVAVIVYDASADRGYYEDSINLPIVKLTDAAALDKIKDALGDQNSSESGGNANDMTVAEMYAKIVSMQTDIADYEKAQIAVIAVIDELFGKVTVEDDGTKTYASDSYTGQLMAIQEEKGAISSAELISVYNQAVEAVTSGYTTAKQESEDAKAEADQAKQDVKTLVDSINLALGYATAGEDGVVTITDPEHAVTAATVESAIEKLLKDNEETIKQIEENYSKTVKQLESAIAAATGAENGKIPTTADDYLYKDAENGNKTTVIIGNQASEAQKTDETYTLTDASGNPVIGEDGNEVVYDIYTTTTDLDGDGKEETVKFYVTDDGVHVINEDGTVTTYTSTLATLGKISAELTEISSKLNVYAAGVVQIEKALKEYMANHDLTVDFDTTDYEDLTTEQQQIAYINEAIAKLESEYEAYYGKYNDLLADYNDVLKLIYGEDKSGQALTKEQISAALDSKVNNAVTEALKQNADDAALIEQGAANGRAEAAKLIEDIIQNSSTDISAYDDTALGTALKDLADIVSEYAVLKANAENTKGDISTTEASYKAIAAVLNLDDDATSDQIVAAINVLLEEKDNAYQSGYEAGYAVGYEEGSSGSQPSANVNEAVQTTASPSISESKAAQLVPESGNVNTSADGALTASALTATLINEAIPNAPTDVVEVVAAADISYSDSIPDEGIDITFNVDVVEGDEVYVLHCYDEETGAWEQLETEVGDGYVTAHFASLSPVVIVKAVDASALGNSAAAVQVLNNRIASLSETVSTLSDQNETLESANETLSAKYDTVSSQSEALVKQMSTMSSQLMSLRNNSENLSGTNDTLATQNESLSSQNTKLTTANETLSTANETLKADNEKLTTANEKLTSENTSLSEKNTTLTETNKSLKSANATLTSKNKSLSATNSKLKSSNSSLTSANATLKNTNTSLSGQVASLKSSNATLSAQNASLKSSNASLQSQAASSRTSAPALSQSNAGSGTTAQVSQSSTSAQSSSGSKNSTQSNTGTASGTEKTGSQATVNTSDTAKSETPAKEETKTPSFLNDDKDDQKEDGKINLLEDDETEESQEEDTPFVIADLDSNISEDVFASTGESLSNTTGSVIRNSGPVIQNSADNEEGGFNTKRAVGIFMILIIIGAGTVIILKKKGIILAD